MSIVLDEEIKKQDLLKKKQDLKFSEIKETEESEKRQLEIKKLLKEVEKIEKDIQLSDKNPSIRSDIFTMLMACSSFRLADNQTLGSEPIREPLFNTDETEEIKSLIMKKLKNL